MLPSAFLKQFSTPAAAHIAKVELQKKVKALEDAYHKHPTPEGLAEIQALIKTLPDKKKKKSFFSKVTHAAKGFVKLQTSLVSASVHPMVKFNKGKLVLSKQTSKLAGKHLTQQINKYAIPVGEGVLAGGLIGTIGLGAAGQSLANKAASKALGVPVSGALASGAGDTAVMDEDNSGGFLDTIDNIGQGIGKAANYYSSFRNQLGGGGSSAPASAPAAGAGSGMGQKQLIWIGGGIALLLVLVFAFRRK